MVNKDFSEDINLLKYYICKMCLLAQSGHPSSSLSCSDIIGTLYFSIMDDNDKFILSKGHAAPALYSALMIKKIIPKEYIDKLREIDSPLQGHPDISRLPEANITSGALGQGLSFSIGLATALSESRKISRLNPTMSVYCEPSVGHLYHRCLESPEYTQYHSLPAHHSSAHADAIRLQQTQERTRRFAEPASPS